MFDVVGLGENSIDEIYQLPTCPQPNSGTLPGGTEGNTGSRRGGGKG